MPLALTAHLRAVSRLEVNSKPLVMDLPAAGDLAEVLDTLVPRSAKRFIAFFGMMPNFEPHEALGPLASALRNEDSLLISANLAPGDDYQAGVKKVLPLYDNELTRQWLATSLKDAGLQVSADEIQFGIESVNDLLRIEAYYPFLESQSIRMDGEEFNYAQGEKFRLFFSYRHTPERLRNLLGANRIEVRQQWITGSGEEGVFLCRKSG
jgi:hypothetical protein